MFQRIAFCLCMLFCFTINAQTINLRGVVSNQAAKPIVNAIVTLVGQGLKDTTGADGAYLFSRITAVVSPIALIPQKQTIVLENGFLQFSVPNLSQVKVEIFDVQGNLLKKESLRNASRGFYRFNIEENNRSSNLLIVRTSIDQDAFTFRYLPLRSGKYFMNPSNGSLSSDGGRLAKVAAISDTLKVTASGYTAKAQAITSYDQQLNISLDSAGTALPSAGCGKTTTINGETRVTINVPAASTGNRDYIIRLPTDYDPNHPYRLIFSIHCLNGTAAGVASGGSGNNYQYYGLWKLANPTGGKGTTIFCSPQGISNGWGQGAKDLEFFRAMIRKFESELCIDQSRIFCEGFSMGGSQSYALSCAMPDTFRAACMHSGGSMSGCDGSHRGPVPMFITHGTNDNVCWWTQGYGQKQINDLAKRDGCDTADLFALCKPTDQSGMTPVTYNYKNCSAGYPCKACIFVGGHDPSPGGEKNTWVDDSTWNYFKQF
jgi:poly(3-hydroxybutyrate) depolymerase